MEKIFILGISFVIIILIIGFFICCVDYIKKLNKVANSLHNLNSRANEVNAKLDELDAKLNEIEVIYMERK